MGDLIPHWIVSLLDLVVIEEYDLLEERLTDSVSL